MSWLSDAVGFVKNHTGAIVGAVATGAIGLPGAGAIIGGLVSKVGGLFGTVEGNGIAAAQTAAAATGAIGNIAAAQAQATVSAAAAAREGTAIAASHWENLIKPVAIAAGVFFVGKLLLDKSGGGGSRGRSQWRG